MSPKNNLASIAQMRSKIIGYLIKHLSTQSTTINLESSTNWTNARKFGDIPGPTQKELIQGFMPGGLFYKKPYTDYVLNARGQYGDLYRLPGMFGKADILMAFDVEDFQKVFQTEGMCPQRPGMESMDYYTKNYQAGLYDKAKGLLNTYGEEWENFRTAVSPIVLQPRNVTTYLDPMQEIDDEFIERIRQIRDPVTNEVPGNFLDELNRLTFESIVMVALNKRLGLVRNDDRPESRKLFSNFRTFLQLEYEMDYQSSLSKYVGTTKLSQYIKCLDEIFDTIIRFVDEHENCAALGDSELSVLKKLIKVDRAVAIVMAVDMLTAGVDTSTTVITGTLLQIAKNPQKQAILREEVHQVLPKKDSKFTMHSMKNLPYLRACIKEGIRMHPIGPGMLRYTGEDLVLRGYRIPKGTQILMNANLLQKEDKYFPKPNEFVPERWVRGNSMEHVMTPLTYIPFGIGPRMCIGRRIVNLELEVTIARLVRNFYIEFNHSIENAFQPYFVNTPVIPLKFKFTELES